MSEKKRFEEALTDLEGIVSSLEGDLPLDEAIAAFEKGIALSKICMDDLKEEKGKLSILMDDLNNITKDLELD